MGAATLVVAAWIIGYSWRRCYGKPAQAVHGAICLSFLESGIQFSNDLMTGHPKVFLNAYSKHYQMIQTWNTQ